MGIRRCKLPRKLQLRLLENFVLQVTARSAADVHGIQANTVALFYRKIRLVIAEKLEAEAVLFAGEIEVDESYFGACARAREVVGLLEKFPCLVCSSAAVKCMRCRPQTPEKKLSCRLSGGK